MFSSATLVEVATNAHPPLLHLPPSENPLSITGCTIAAVFPVDHDREHAGFPGPAPSRMHGCTGARGGAGRGAPCQPGLHVPALTKPTGPLNTTISLSELPFVSMCPTSKQNIMIRAKFEIFSPCKKELLLFRYKCYSHHLHAMLCHESDSSIG